MSRLQKIPNATIRSKMQAEKSVLDRIQRRQLKWYGHLLRMDDSVGPKKIYQWTPQEKRKTATIMEEPSDGLDEKQKHVRRYGRG